MKHTVLVVDDETDNVDALERLFRRNYHVLKATSGAEALKHMQNQEVSLIVSDQRMPNMTGVEFLAESIKIQPDTIRILLTGYTDIESVISAINSGHVYRYVTKPWDPVDLTNTVDKAIERYELSAQLKAKNQELAAALAELRTLDEAKSSFMILINHELKTPLTSMLSFLELLGETKLDAEQKKYVQRIGQSAERLHVLINDSLELVSAETGMMHINPQPVELESLVEELVKSLAAEMKKKGVAFKRQFAVTHLKTDPVALRSVLKRLLDNAVKFGHEGSAIELQIGAAGDDAVCSLRNWGKPVKPETIAKILKPFSLDENVMHHSKGTGLGLSVVKALLSRMGSQLTLQTDGDQFTASFRIPANGE